MWLVWLEGHSYEDHRVILIRAWCLVFTHEAKQLAVQIGRFQPERAKASKFRLLVDEDSPACQEIHGHLYYVIIKEQARTSKLGAKASALLNF
jgi:hypothetical protein